jgi:hypothetical protein
MRDAVSGFASGTSIIVALERSNIRIKSKRVVTHAATRNPSILGERLRVTQGDDVPTATRAVATTTEASADMEA